MSIKVKVLIAVLSIILSLSLIITLISINKSTDAMLEANFDKLNTVEVAKHSEIKNYLNYLKGLLTSLATQEGTKEAFLAFEDGFYTLQDELNLDINMIKESLKRDMESNYLNSVNYSVPMSEQRKSTQNYLPSLAVRLTTASSAQSEITNSVSIMTNAVTKVDDMVQGYLNNGKTIESMVTQVEVVNELSVSNVRSVEEIASASDHLSSMTSKLNALLSSYKT